MQETIYMILKDLYNNIKNNGELGDPFQCSLQSKQNTIQDLFNIYYYTGYHDEFYVTYGYKYNNFFSLEYYITISQYKNASMVVEKKYLVLANPEEIFQKSLIDIDGYDGVFSEEKTIQLCKTFDKYIEFVSSGLTWHLKEGLIDKL